jgi:hypothetical protein
MNLAGGRAILRAMKAAHPLPRWILPGTQLFRKMMGAKRIKIIVIFFGSINGMVILAESVTNVKGIAIRMQAASPGIIANKTQAKIRKCPVVPDG